MRTIPPERLADWLVRNQLKFANELYNALCFKINSGSDYDTFWRNPYVRKYISLEDALRKHKISVEPFGPPQVARGLAVNIALVRTYLCGVFDVPF